MIKFSTVRICDESAIGLQIMCNYLLNIECPSHSLVELAHSSLASARVLLSSAASSCVESQPASLSPPSDGAGAILSPTRTQKPAKVGYLRPITAQSDPNDRSTGFIRNGQRTVFDDHIVCLLDGSTHVFLRRHLRKKGIPEQAYLREFDLPRDYPLTAPSYVIRQRKAAKKTKFGTAIRPKREQK